MELLAFFYAGLMHVQAINENYLHMLCYTIQANYRPDSLRLTWILQKSKKQI